MNKELRKCIMLRTRLKNKFNIEKTEIAKINFKKQRNLCTNILRKAKRAYYKKLNPSLVSNNKQFWKTVRPSFSGKLNSNHNITLIEKGQIICDDKKIALVFNDFFANAVKHANKTLDPEFSSNSSHKTDPVLYAIEKYKYHPSILKIKETYGETNLFKCGVISLQSMLEQISIIKTSKGSPLNAG